MTSNPVMRASAVSITFIMAAILAAPAARAQTVPFATSNNVILLPVSINGSAPMPFILDTGASGTVIGERAAGELGLSSKAAGETTTQGGSVRSASVRPVLLSFGGVKMPPAKLTAIPLDGLEAGFGTRIDGILGYEVFRRFVVEIDYAAGAVTFGDPRTFRYHGSGSRLPFTFVDRTPFVDVSLTADGAKRPVRATMLVDTGNVSTMNLYPGFVKKYGLFGTGSPTLNITFGALISGLAGRVGRIGEMRLGRSTIGGSFVTLPAKANGDAYKDGLIGGEVLRRFRVIIDYSRRLIILEPNKAALSQPYDFDAAGISLAAGGPGLRTIRVRSIIEGSPAAAAGILRDDVITHIDGRPVSQTTLEDIRREFRRPGRTFHLTIERGDEHKDVTITTRRLI